MRENRALYLWCVGVRGPVFKFLLQALVHPFCLQQLLLKLQKLLPGHRRTGLLLAQLEIPRMRGWAKHHSGPQVLHLEDRGRALVSHGALKHRAALENVKQRE